MENMEVGAVEFANGFTSPEGESKDWHLANLHATFSHKEACEFIFWVGSDEESRQRRLEELKELGFSSDFLGEIEAAQKLDFKYLCFYA